MSSRESIFGYIIIILLIPLIGSVLYVFDLYNNYIESLRMPSKAQFRTDVNIYCNDLKGLLVIYMEADYVLSVQNNISTTVQFTLSNNSSNISNIEILFIDAYPSEIDLSSNLAIKLNDVKLKLNNNNAWKNDTMLKYTSSGGKGVIVFADFNKCKNIEDIINIEDISAYSQLINNRAENMLVSTSLLIALISIIISAIIYVISLSKKC